MPDSAHQRGIDPRGPRIIAGITAALLLIDVFVAMIGAMTAALSLLIVINVLFAWGVLSPRTAPWAVLFRTLVQPRLSAPTDLEDPRPPRFAQGVGLLVTGVGIVVFLLGVQAAVPVAAALAFVAAFLNAAFGLCLGCQLYLLLQRIGVIGRRRSAAV